MNGILRKRSWLRWAMLWPLATLCAESSCSLTEAMREAADGLTNTANSLAGKKTNDVNQLIDDIQKLFD